MSYQSNGIGTGGMTPMVKDLLYITIGAFVLERVFPIIFYYGGLPFDWFRGMQIWRLITYMFLHADIFHILMNMYALYMFGPSLERVLGKYQFLTLYFLSGILGGLGWSLLAKGGYCIGASGAVFGLLGSYALLFPDDRLQLLFPPVVLKAWQLILGYGVIELVQVLGQSGGRVANSAHLFGGIAGAIYTLVLIRKYEPWRFRRIFKWLDSAKKANSQNQAEKQAKKEAEELKAQRQKIDEILGKVSREGIGSLTASERETLRNARKR